MKTYSQLGKVVLVLALGQFAHSAAFATIYDAAADFSSSTNPHSVWTYGWESTLGGSFNTDVAEAHDPFSASGLEQWRGDQPANADGNPSVFKNTTGSELDFSTIKMLAGSLAFHPGSAGQDSVVRFTAPSAGEYIISGLFTGIDTTGTTTDVHILENGISIFDGLINGDGSTAGSGPTTLLLAEGATIDFAVGFGPNGTFFNDATGLGATVTSVVPESSTIVAGALLLLPFGMSALRSLRRNRTA